MASQFTKQQINAVYAALKDRLIHPDGSFDKQGRWYPSEAENADDYTASLRYPSRAWPYSYLTGARTLKHVKALADANPAFFAKKLAAVEATLARTQEVAA